MQNQGKKEKEESAKVKIAKRKQIPPCPILCRIQYSGTESINTDN